MHVARRIGIVGLLVAACGGADDDGNEEGTPILELAPRVSRACRLASPATMIGDGLVNDFRLTSLGGSPFALTARNDQMIALSELQLEPIALRAPTWSTSTWQSNGGVNAAVREGGGLAIAWHEVDYPAYRVAVAVVDERGAQIGTTRYMPADTEGYPRMFARPGGFALTWSTPAGRQLQSLDLDGAPTGAPSTLARSGYVVRHGDGFAAAWFEGEPGSQTVHAVLLDANGARRTEPQQLWAKSDRHSYGLFVTSLGADVLVAWEEHYFPEGIGDEGGHAIVRVARMSSDGAIAEPVRRLQAPEAGVVNVNPTILSVDGAIALSWARGGYIAICGGCVTDYRMNFVELDPVDLAPVSNLVEVVGDAGLRSAPIESIDGRDFAYLLAIDRHARFDLAAAMVRCEATP